MTRDERIEAVRLAIVDSAAWLDCEPMKDYVAAELAKAAILATLQSLLEPSEGMVEAGSNAAARAPSGPWFAAKMSFPAMIQQAIKEME